MARLFVVRLCGFKGFDRAVKLDVRNVLSGPNESGKSAVLEAIVYALSGRVPDGATLDEVAKLFPPAGGSVRLVAADGHWIERGITIDHAKSKVSEVLACSDTGPDEKPDLSRWAAADAVLDLRNFLGLSAAKRREFVLALAGKAGEAKPEEMLDAAALEYAREIGGPAATLATLDSPDATAEETAEWVELAMAWRGARGLREALRSRAAGRKTTEAIAEWIETAREQKNLNRRAAVDAEAAVRDLEAAAKGARIAAADVERAKRELAAAREANSRAREGVAARQQVVNEHGRAARESKSAHAELERLTRLAANAPDPGKRPELPAPDTDRVARLDAEETTLRASLARLLESESRLRTARAKLEEANGYFAAYVEQLATHEKAPLGELAAAAGEVPDSAHGGMPRLRAAIVAVTDAWRQELERKRERVERAKELAFNLEENVLSQAVGEAARVVAAQADEQRLAALAAERGRLVSAQRERETAWKVADAEWVRRREDFADATSSLAAAENELRRAEAAAERACERLARLGPEPDTVATAEAAKTAEQALQRATEAAGAVQAYENAVERARSHQVQQKAWSACERALARVREQFVVDVLKPLLDELGELLSACGRDERPYCLLENDRGKPVFDIGVDRGETRVSLSGLSGGAGMLFCACLSLVIARRSRGRKVLLLEADTLDGENLRSLLDGLAGIPDELDACLVATASPVPEVDGWTVQRLGEEVVVA